MPHAHPPSLGVLLRVLAEVDEQPHPVDAAQAWHLLTFPLGLSREPSGAGLWAQKAHRDHRAHHRWS